MLKKQSQNGRSMIEMLGVLAIVGVLSVGGIAGYTKAMRKYKINKTAQQISWISSRVQSVYGPKVKYRYNGLNNLVAIKLGLVPDEMIKNAATGELEDAFGGKVHIRGISVGFNDSNGHHYEDGFQIVFQSLPDDALVDIVSQDWKGQSDRFLGVMWNLPSEAPGYW